MQTGTPFFLSCSEVNSTGYFGVWRANQRARLTLSTVLVYTNYNYIPISETHFIIKLIWYWIVIYHVLCQPCIDSRGEIKMLSASELSSNWTVLSNVKILLLLCFRHIPEALNDFKPDIIAYNAGKLLHYRLCGFLVSQE